MTTTSVRRRSLLAAIAVAAIVASCGLRGPAPLGGEGPTARGNLGPEFMWAVAEPTRAIGPIDPDEARAAVDGAAETIEADRDDAFGISIVALFEEAEQAEAHADAIREILAESAAWYADPANAEAKAARDDPDRQAPLTPPEEAAMRENLLAPGTRGVGWGGAAEAADDAVYTIGPLLVVTGLESDSFATDFDAPLHPLAHLLAAVGADVRLEGDRFGEGSIVADISCRLADRATGAALVDEIGDAIVTGQLNTRPPWIGQPITADEALARATYRRWLEGFWAGANDPRFLEFAQRYANASSTEERETALREFEQYMIKQGLEHIEGELDPAVISLIVNPPDSTDTAAHDAWKRDISGRMGPVPVEPSEFGDRPSAADYDQLAWTGGVRLNGDRLELGWLSFGRFSAAMPKLAAYLEERGCDDLRLGTVDFDAVRGD